MCVREFKWGEYSCPRCQRPTTGSDTLCLGCVLDDMKKSQEQEREEAGKPQRIPDQPPPAQGNPHPPVADMVKQDAFIQEYTNDPRVVGELMADIEERKNVGIARYGTPLRGFDGRDNWIDLYQEILDALNYFRKAIYEVSQPTSVDDVDRVQMVHDYKALIRIAVEIRAYITRRKVDKSTLPG